MTQKPLFDGVSNEDNAAKFIGQRLYLEFKDDIQTHVALYHNDVLVKAADLTDKVAKKIFCYRSRRAWRYKNPSCRCT